MRKKFAWFFCIFMSSLVLLSCSEDNKKGEEPGDGTGGGTPEGDTKTYFETTYSDLSAYVDKNVSEIWAAVGNASKDEENNILYVQDQKGNRYKATFKLDGTMIATIEMVLTGSSENKGIEVWESMISSFRDYKLGTFLGTKFKDYATGEGGIKQTTEETIPLLTLEANTLIYPVFGIQKKVYCCPIMDKDKFRVEMCRNYLPLDFSTLGKYVGANIDETLQEFYAISNKILFGTAMAYLYFDSAIDLKGNNYTVNFDSDKTLETVLEISAYIPENEQTIARWKDLLQNYADYKLGKLKEMYVTDAFGDKVQDLADAQAAFDLYESNGRNNGIIARFETAYGNNSLILNKDFCYILVRKS